MTPTECDVLVIGGGPAGSTAAALLAERGRDVVLLEKAEHPRFHIGESLLPLNTAIFDRLGIRDQVAAIGVHKPGAEFVADDTGRAVQFSFAQGLDQRFTSSWQVPRADLDHLLFHTAADRGARVYENTRVTAFQPGADRPLVEADGPDGPQRFAPRFVLDASGRDTFMASRLRAKRPNKRNNTAALYAHFHGVERRTGEHEGYISVHLAQDGWFWMIPLPNDVMSVGFVGNPAAFKTTGGTPSDRLLARIQAAPTVRDRMRGATLVSDVVGTGNYSYDSDRAHGDRFLMIGDAFAFLDPVFSSGVLLAMTSGEMGADVADTWLADPAAGRAKAVRMERDIRRAMRRLAWLVYRINTPALRFLFLQPSNRFRMRDGLVSLLAGNLRGSWNQVGPVLAFKSAYYFVSVLARIGLLPPARPEPRRAAAEGLLLDAG